LSYFGGALDAGLAASAAAAAFFRESFAACFFSAAILRGLEPAAAELSLELTCEIPAVSEAPGVPGVFPVAASDGAAACPQALIQINAATGTITIQYVRLYTMITSPIQQTCANW
jgi:hypothetical protein